MTAENLSILLEDMRKETERKSLKWRLEVATSEYRSPKTKPTVEADGKTWTVDECFVSYNCTFRGNEFSMITYENIETAGNDVRTTNLVFLPPLAMRIFRLDELAPYAVETTESLTAHVHALWNTLLTRYKENSGGVAMDVREIEVKETQE